ncbi:MAG: ABC transporter ATP-binding protein [Cytophagales bacterium]|nr:ABC transporter ATP-binding protein [Cytophagales bacterium]
MTNALLRAEHLTKRFGGLAAVNDVSIDLVFGQIHAVIGPNGAGKSTLTNLLSGDLALTSGRMVLGDQDITGWPMERISRQGIGRSFQKTNVFLPLSVFENVRLAAHFDLAQTQQAIRLAKLEHQAQTVASNMSHGEQRQLEIAMCLATQPQVLILDEPLAGMGTVEAKRMIELLHTLKANHAILLIEHDMDAVFALADVLTVMVNGQVIASGTPENVRADATVQAAYLGDAHE